MTYRKLASAGAGAAAALIFVSSAFAQQSTAPAAAPVQHGAPLTGVCLFSSGRVVATSAVGKYVNTRLQQIATQVSAELQAEQTALENEAKALDAGRATLDEGTLEKRASDLQVRANALRRKAEQRQRELEATRQKAFVRVAQEMDPVINQVYQARRCSLLLGDQAVMAANPAMDISDAVVAALNAKIQQFAFDRERLDQQPAAAQPGRR